MKQILTMLLLFIATHSFAQTDKKLSPASNSITNLPSLSKEDIKVSILKQSKKNGKLDFFTEIKGHEYNAIQIKPGVFSTNQEFALYKWGEANSDQGVNTPEDALSIWTELKGRAASEQEIKNITMGFKRELENM